MNDIERLEKFIRQRTQWKRMDPSSYKSDLQKVHWLKGRCWLWLLVYTFLLGNSPASLSEYGFWETVQLVVFSCVAISLIFEVWRISKLEAIFERHFIQNAEDLIRDIERQNSEQRIQPK